MLDSELQHLNRVYIKIQTHTEELKRFRAGPLLHQILFNFNTTLKGGTESVAFEEGEKSRKLYLISGQDLTLGSLLNTLNLYSENDNPLSFASAVVFELHRIQNSNEHEVKVCKKKDF